MVRKMAASGHFQHQDTHRDALVHSAADRLVLGDAQAAFMLSDRRSRLSPLAKARVFVLRGEALAHLGETGSAEAAFARAFAIDPTDTLVARRQLSSPDHAVRNRAARLIIAAPLADPASLDQALTILMADGPLVTGALVLESGRLVGWLSWNSRRDLEVRLQHGAGADQITTLRLERGEADTNAGAPFYRNRLDIPLFVEGGARIQILADGEAGLRQDIALRINPKAPSFTPSRPNLIADRTPDAATVSPLTVIVPIYDDPEITGRCLRALGAQTLGPGLPRVILVHDKPGDRVIDTLVESQADEFDYDILVNAENLGFVESVNKALALVSDGDVVLLNADVLLPAGALDRMSACAASDSTIGTIVPLSNNGELANFPDPLDANPLPTFEAIERIDRVAARVNAGLVVDLPNGIGFCLYITRACLDAVGSLSGAYLRGYFEDIEFCLRAEALGFRNVCACDVFVGHKGTSSFKEDKHALVVRNKRVLMRRYPRFEDATRAFLLADPLAGARAAIERAAPPPSIATLIITGHDRRALADERAETLHAAQIGVLILTLPALSRRDATLRAPGKGAPQTLGFSLATRAGQAALFAYLDRLALRQIEIADGADVDEGLLAYFKARGRRLVALFDESRIQAPHRTHEEGCDSPVQTQSPCQSCLSAFKNAGRTQGAERPAVPMNGLALALAKRERMPIADHAAGQDNSQKPVSPARDGQGVGVRRVLGIPYPRPTLATERFLLSACRSLSFSLPDLEILVIGQALDDLRLMGVGNTFVTGPVEDDGYGDVLRHYGVAALFGPERWSGFGLVERLAAGTGTPTAFFDWSFGVHAARQGDLALDPRLCDAKATALLAVWCEQAVGAWSDHVVA